MNSNVIKEKTLVTKRNETTEGRKIEHILICLSKDVEAKEKTTGLNDIEFVHVSLPEINKTDVDTVSYTHLTLPTN